MTDFGSVRQMVEREGCRLIRQEFSINQDSELFVFVDDKHLDRGQAGCFSINGLEIATYGSAELASLAEERLKRAKKDLVQRNRGQTQ